MDSSFDKWTLFRHKLFKYSGQILGKRNAIFLRVVYPIKAVAAINSTRAADQQQSMIKMQWIKSSDLRRFVLYYNSKKRETQGMLLLTGSRGEN